MADKRSKSPPPLKEGTLRELHERAQEGKKYLNALETLIFETGDDLSAKAEERMIRDFFGLLKGLFVTFLLLIPLTIGETYYRKYNPLSPARPSILIAELTQTLSFYTAWLGEKLAWLTDIYSWIKDYIQDFATIFKGMLQLVILPIVEFFNAQAAYYEKIYSSSSASPFFILSLGLIGLTLVILMSWKLTLGKKKYASI